jgi:hypothetical protein
MKSLIHPKDRYAMNWVEGATEWGTVICPPALTCDKLSLEEGENIRESYRFTNISAKPVFVQTGEISVYAPFHDSYEETEVCLRNRCHAHIWCGREVSYILGLRMGGEPPHLGLTLMKGSLGTYSVERDEEQGCNDRGDFLLHPFPFTLEPGESYELEWVLFWHEGEEDFYRKLKEFGRFIDVQTEKYVYEPHQKVKLKFVPSFEYAPESVKITRNGLPVPFKVKETEVSATDCPEEAGAYEYQIEIGGIHTVCRLFVQLPLKKLVKKRCRFITENQQYHNKNSRLNGAYLIYDNEEHKLHYDSESDHNAGRERVGMGVLLALYLQTSPDPDMMESLKLYIDFVYRELFDEQTGEVFNDAGRDNSEIRLYNYPWMAQFFLELYLLFEDRKYVTDAYQVLKYYYEHGGLEYYAVATLPLMNLIYYMEIVGMENEHRMMMKYLYEHARYLVKNGTHYPPHEVRYEHRIVASAARQLLKCYILQKEKIFLAAAEEHLKILDLFHGHQPDYRLYEIPIRHWDGRRFGKKRLYGDTFPHYWGVLTGSALDDYAAITGREELRRRAEACCSGALSLFAQNGSAGCASLFPFRVNGEPCRGLDPWANDQDWALYYLWKLRFRAK